MGKKGLIGVSIVGGVCLIGLLAWSLIFLSSNQKKKGTEISVVSESSEKTTSSTQENRTALQEDGIEMVDSDVQELEKKEGKGDAAETVSSKKKNHNENDTSVGKGDNSKKNGTSGRQSAQNNSSSGDKKKNSKNNNKDNKNSSGGKNGSSGSGSNANNNSNSSNTNSSSTNSSGNGVGSSDNSQSSQSGQSQNNNTDGIHKSVVDGLTITSEQADCTVSGSTATIKKAGTYTLTGTLSNGQVIVDTEKTSKVVIICKSMSLNCSHTAPFYVKSADEVTLQLAAGTTNSITDGASYTFSAADKEPDAACFSEEDLTIEGSGTLVVTGQYQDGIASKNDIKVKEGTVQVTAADDGIRGKDGIKISGGNVKVISQSHGFKTTENLQAAKGMVEIEGGSVHLDTVGDGIHATNQIKVSGGSTYIDAKNEGLDTDSSFLMTGGTMVIDGPKSSNRSMFDCAKGAVVNGGTFFAVGSSPLAKSLGSSSSQNTLFYKAPSEQETDTTVKIMNTAGKTVYQHKVTRKYQCVVYSAPELGKGNYSVYCDSVKLGNCKVD